MELHLIDESPQANYPLVWRWIGNALARSDAPTKVLAVGSGALVERASQYGLSVDHRMPKPSILHPASILRFTKRFDSSAAAYHVYSAELASHFRRLDVQERTAVHLLSGVHDDLQWSEFRNRLPAAARYRVATLGLRERLIAAGIAPSQIHGTSPEPREFLPAAEVNSRPLSQQSDCPTVAVLADPPSNIDALNCVLSVGLARETGRSVRLALPPQARGLENARAMLTGAGRGDVLLVRSVFEDAVQSLQQGDLILAPLAGPSLCLLSLVPQLPVLAPDTPDHRMLLQGHPSVTFLPRFVPGRIAGRLCQLLDELKKHTVSRESPAHGIQHLGRS